MKILCYWGEEDECWVALSLEFDLLGHGETQDAAILELCGAIATQLDYALEIGDPGIAIFPADEMYFELFEAYRS